MSREQLDAIRKRARDAEPLDLREPIESVRSKFSALLNGFPVPSEVTYTRATIGSVPVCEGLPRDSGDEPIVLYFHGGAFVSGSAWDYRSLWGTLASCARLRVIAVDYRLAPEHPFPAALGDSVGVYEALLKRGVSPDAIAFAGDSAGGGLAISTLVRARDAGLPMPGAAAVISPWADLACQGVSMTEMASQDISLDAKGLLHCARQYLADQRADNPFASPVHADLRSLPSLLIQVGTAEVLLDDAFLLARRAASAHVDVRLEVEAGMPHVWHAFASFLDEGQEAIRRAAEFLRTRLQR